MLRQGDVLLVPVESAPLGAKEVARGECILARGEVTGHAHRVVDEAAAIVEAAERRYLVLGRPAILAHEEHAHLAVPAGTYEVRTKRVYAPEGERRLAD